MPEFEKQQPPKPQQQPEQGPGPITPQQRPKPAGQPEQTPPPKQDQSS